MALYAHGRRRVLPPLVFGLGVLGHLVRHGQDYDVVHLASFPYVPLLLAGTWSRVSRVPLVVDWWEVWTGAYWGSYLGPVLGRLGAAAQTLAARVPQRAVSYSRLHAARLSALAPSQPCATIRTVLPAVAPSEPRPSDGHLLFVGRLIPEKRADALLPALVLARSARPALRAVIVGDGPELPSLRAAVHEVGLDDAVALLGFVAPERLDALRRGALALVLPSAREGYGLVVLEAAAVGVPSIVVAGEDNAATEWVVPGVNGFVAPSASADALASAILAVHAGGDRLRASTAAWHADLAADAVRHPAIDTIVALYADAVRERAMPDST